MPVDSLHPDYEEMLPVWTRARDVLAGEDAVKAAGEKLFRCQVAAHFPARLPRERSIRGLTFAGANRAQLSGSCAVDSAEGIGFKHAANLIAHFAEDFHLFLFVARCMGRIDERPMVAVHLAGIDWTGLVGISANGDDGFDLAIE